MEKGTMENQKMYTSAELCDRFGLKFSALNYLINERIIPRKEIIRRGAGRKRLYTERAFEIVEKWATERKQ
jgi:hypothetical protein